MKKRALISVYDKIGILDFAKFLVNKGIEIISTGGTYKYLKENNIEVIEVSKITNFEEMFLKGYGAHSSGHSRICADRQ